MSKYSNHHIEDCLLKIWSNSINCTWHYGQSFPKHIWVTTKESAQVFGIIVKKPDDHHDQHSAYMFEKIIVSILSVELLKLKNPSSKGVL